jgi:CPA2 family monovalent cation:H+ antiporter-2
MQEAQSFSSLLLVVFLAFLVPLVLSRFKRLRLPIVVGEILVGILIGRSGLGWVDPHDPMLVLLAEFGFVFLMFLSGMEIDFSSIRLVGSREAGGERRRVGPVQIGSLTFALTLAMAIPVGFLLVGLDLVQSPWMMALILSTTSLGVVMPVLKENNLSGGQYGQSVLISALIADFATMLLITVVVAILSTGLTFDILLIGLLFVAVFLMYYFGMFFFNRTSRVRKAVEELSHASAQIKVRGAFTIMLVFVVLSEVLGTEVILGAFLAGAIVALLKTPSDADLTHKLEAIGFGFFIPIFFIMVGVEFNLMALVSSSQATLLVPVLLLAAIAVKFLPALSFRLNFPWHETFAAGTLLVVRLSLIIAASEIGLQMGLISEALNAAIILVAIVTVTVAPVVFSRFNLERDTRLPRDIIVAGADDLGLRVAEQLQSHNEHVVLIDPEDNRIARAQRLGFDAVVARLDCPDDCATPFLENAKAVVCTHRDSEVNYKICQLAHVNYGIKTLVAQVNEPEEIERFRRLGVNTTNAALDGATMLAMVARNPAAYNLLTSTEDDKEVIEVSVRGGYCDGKTLRQLEMPGDVLVLALRRNGELLVPHGDTELVCGDRLTLAGSVEPIDSARQMFRTVNG